MLLKDIYKNCVQIGIKNDPRGLEAVEKALKQTQKAYEKGEKDATYFDMERLSNPYADTRILYGDPESEIKHLLAGIDIEVGEVLLADRLREKKRPIDAIISHHPEGRALAGIYNVMDMHSDLFNQLGISITVAEALLEERQKEVERRLMPINHNRAVMASQLLDVPFLCCHTPADNCVTSYLQAIFDEKRPYLLGDIIDILMEIPEYKNQAEIDAGPKILIGSEEKRCGKVYVDMTGGTEIPKTIYQRLSQEGLGTIVGMHLSEDGRKEAKAHHINVVIAGHTGSDSLGMNLLFDQLCVLHPIDIIPCSGLIYHKRNQK